MSARPGVLVTGAAGFFGLAIVRALTGAGHAVLAVDRAPAAEHHPRCLAGAELAYERRDLASEPLDDLIGPEIETVVHAAALTPGDERGDALDELLSVNLAPLPGVLSALRRSPRARRLIFVSSAAVYPADRDALLREEDASGGASLYGAAKLAAELTLARYAELAALEYAIVRPTSLYGPGEERRPSRPRLSAFKALVEAARAGESVRIENGGARTDWLHVDDAGDAVAALAACAPLPGGAFSLSSGMPRTLDELAAEVAGASGLVIDDAAATAVALAGDRPARIVNERLAHAVGWRPERTVAQATRELLAEPPVAALMGGAR